MCDSLKEVDERLENILGWVYEGVHWNEGVNLDSVGFL